MKTIKLPCYGIVVELGPEDEEHPGAFCGGSISSELKEDKRRTCLNSALDAIESIVMAHACAGVDIEALDYIEGLETSVEAIFNNLT